MFRLVNGGEKLPQRATRYSAGFDVFANEDVVIGAGETKLVGLGIALDGDQFAKTFFAEYTRQEVMESFYLELHPRSSLRAKGLGGGIGIVDIDYHDEIKIVVTNQFNYLEITQLDAVRTGTRFDTDAKTMIRPNPPFVIKKGDKIGQLILKRHEGWLLPSEYTLDVERNGGFGSTSCE